LAVATLDILRTRGALFDAADVYRPRAHGCTSLCWDTAEAILIGCKTVRLSRRNDAPVIYALVIIQAIVATVQVVINTCNINPGLTSVTTILDAAHVARFRSRIHSRQHRILSSQTRRITIEATHGILSAACSRECTAGASNTTGREAHDAPSLVVAVSVGVAAAIPLVDGVVGV
jgi:hypothetical protein